MRRKKHRLRKFPVLISLFLILTILGSGVYWLLGQKDNASVFCFDRLVLINSEHLCSSDSVPDSLVEITDSSTNGLFSLEESCMQAAKDAFQAFLSMMADAKKDGVTGFHLASAYRSYENQKNLYDSRVAIYVLSNQVSIFDARKQVEKTVALPGSSEHQSGLAFDINALDENGGKLPFGDTLQFRWLREHCWDYGFILRYPADKADLTGINYEPWHYRYVGLPDSQKIRESGLCLEEYCMQLESST